MPARHARLDGTGAQVVGDRWNSAGEQQLGDWWIDSQTSAVLQVPSFVIAGEHNFLLNPVHMEFARIQVEPPAIFHFDERLFERS